MVGETLNSRANKSGSPATLRKWVFQPAKLMTFEIIQHKLKNHVLSAWS